jgi:hypothetical protein
MLKFERRRAALIKKHEDDLRKLELEEQGDLRKKVDPVAKKLGALVEAEVKKILEKNPELLDGYVFKKRDDAKAMSDALADLFTGNAGTTPQVLNITNAEKTLGTNVVEVGAVMTDSKE